MKSKIAIIGFGNIAKAIITPLLDKKLINEKDVYCLVNTKRSCENLKKNYKYKINIFHKNSEDSRLIWDCQVKLLSVKPQNFKDIVEIQNNQSNNLLISILAGVSLEKLKKKFPHHECVRAVTNIPIIVGKGLTGIAWGSQIDMDKKKYVKKIFENTSIVYEFPEDTLDTFLALTSSSPAIVALIIEALSDGGLSAACKKNFLKNFIEMILGTIKLIRDIKLTTSELRNMVTSPGGTTIAALRVLKEVLDQQLNQLWPPVIEVGNLAKS